MPKNDMPIFKHISCIHPARHQAKVKTSSAFTNYDVSMENYLV